MEKRIIRPDRADLGHGLQMAQPPPFRLGLVMNQPANSPSAAAAESAASRAAAVQLCVQGVTRVFPGAHGKPSTQALRPIDLQVHENDFITVLGPSGCGKSTLLRIIASIFLWSEIVL